MLLKITLITFLMLLIQKKLRFKDINSKIKEALNNFENGVFEVFKKKKKNQSLIKII